MILYVVVPGIQKFESGIQRFASPEIGPMFSVPCHSERSEESRFDRAGPAALTNRRDSRIPRLPNYTIALHESIFASRRRLTAVSEATGE